MTTLATPSHSRLSSHDTVFLHWERPAQPMHVGEVLVYDGTFTAADLVEMLRVRMSALPRYQQKVLFTPFGLSHPSWETDPDFDVANHVDERWMVPGSDDLALSSFVGGLFGELIDRSRPLRHMTVIHGHASGDAIIFLKLHHSMVDGVSSGEIIEVLHAPPPPAVPVAEVTQASSPLMLL
jgi:diacylglycerol O-acyltransferase